VDSSGAQGNFSSISPAISADGRIVVFGSFANNLVAGDWNFQADIFVHDRSTGITERVSVDSSGAEGNGNSNHADVSADGRFVAFESESTNLVAGDSNGVIDVFVHDRMTGITERVSVDSSGAEGNGPSGTFGGLAISADGRIVAFESNASNLVAGDTNGVSDVFVHDRSTGLTERVDVDSFGAEANYGGSIPSISADGQSVTFASSATNLVAGDTNNAGDVFVHDRSTGFTGRVSVDSSGAEGNGLSGNSGLAISADGQIVAFESLASNLVAGDTNGYTDVFVRERCDAFWSNYGAGFPGTNGVPSFTSRTDPVLGTTITLDLANSAGVTTAGLLFLGFQRAQIHSSWGGDLLVVPFLTIVIAIPAAGASFGGGTLPDDDALCGLEIDLQAIESDSGAARNVSFTPGLALVLGR
jgi:hypothetical protein